MKSPFAFVWQPQELGPNVADLTAQTGSRVICDLGYADTGFSEFAGLLKEARVREIKLPAPALLDSSLESFIQAAALTTLWVECHPALVADFPAFLARLAQLQPRLEIIPVTGDMDFLRRLLEFEPPWPALALKGIEAAGLVGQESVSVLYSTCRDWLADRSPAPDLHIWGGLAAPEAVAAYLATGAAGVVFESLHWQTDLAAASGSQRQRLARLRPDHTAVVGANLGSPVRLYDKGNSLAVKNLRDYAASLKTAGLGADAPRTFGQRLLEQAIPPLKSDFGREDLIFLGPEAAFAEAFAQRFGRASAPAIHAFLQAVIELWEAAGQRRDAFLHSPCAQELKIRYPFIQGAMTWISDVPEFARAVAEAGGLPTLALGLRNRQQLEHDFRGLADFLGEHPYAVNLIALPENPFLEEQLAWLEDTRPPFAVIAAGEPAYAQRLLEQGIQVFYIAPDEGLLRLALEAGIPYIILEGNEAGGHVGSHTTLTLAQMALELKRREPELFTRVRLILAGGLYNRETAFRAALLGADAIQMGTAYLTTTEIVATGALTPLYQQLILAAPPGGTAVSGETVGLRVRSLKTPKMTAILKLEQEFRTGGLEEGEFRHRLEALSTQSLLLAARGVRQPGGPTLDEGTCLAEGQFMSGAVAGVLHQVVSVAEFHRRLAQEPLLLSQPRPLIAGHRTSAFVPKRGNGKERIAITGLALVNALGNTPQEIWEAGLALKSGLTEVPLSHWDHSLFYDPDPRAPEKTYCKVGAFTNLDISRKELGIPPHEFRTMSHSTRITMWLAHQAITASGILHSAIPRERIGVLISQNSGESASTLGDLVVGVSAKKIVHSLRTLLPLTPEMESAMEEQIKSGLIRVDDTTLLGRLNCTAGGFICNKYGLMGPSFSVSAACATFLVALYTAIQMIRNGVLDAAVVGGGEELLSPAHFLEFSALGALAGISGVDRPPPEASRPFDATRDGMVLGEGGGMIVIERESVAAARGAPIHAYITGVGASNSDQGMVESLAATQEIAIRAAFADTPYGPEEVDLVECHATSTMQGDVEEVKALKAFFPQGRGPILTSFKSQIGHTLGASGINSLIRAVLAMHAGVMPPTLNYHVPDPEIDLESWGFYVPGQPLQWPDPAHRPRRAMVNAFGFGGANYVVHLEACQNGRGLLLAPPETADLEVSSTAAVAPPPPAVLPKTLDHVEQAPSPVPSQATPPGPGVDGVALFQARLGGRPHRLAVTAADRQTARDLLAGLEPLPVGGPELAKALRALERRGIFAGPAADTPPALALVFAGQGTYYAGMGRELYDTFPVIREWMDRLAQVAEFDLLHLLFHSREEDLRKTLWQQPALYTMEYAMGRCLLSLGLEPAAMAGHSLGELVALSLAGVFSFADGFHIVNKRAQCMEKASTLADDPGMMMAVNVPLDVLTQKVGQYEQVYFTNYNSPRQVVLGGNTEQVLALKEELSGEGYWTYPLKVSMAFHSPIMRVIHAEMDAFLSTVTLHPPRIPVISNTTKKPFPDDPAAIKDIIMAHLESPVHWLQNVQSMWEDFGVRCFVEVGPKDTLCNLVSEIITEAQVLPTCDPEGEARTFRQAAARLHGRGYLPAWETPAPVTLPGETPAPAALAPAAGPAAVTAPAAAPARVAAIVQREINTFVLESFGKFLQPAILAAIRREVDPNFSDRQLQEILGLPHGAPAYRAQATPPGPSYGAPPPGALAPPPVALKTPAPAAAAPPGDILSQIIQIIIDATGYDADEIEPDMDLRQDLAIRSSRLPVIMDAAERQFGIAIQLEDFIGVRTVRELADRVAEVRARDGGAALAAPEQAPVGTPLAPALEPLAPSAAATGTDLAEPAAAPPVQRLVPQEIPLAPTPTRPLNLTPGHTVAVLTLRSPGPIAAGLMSWLEHQAGVRPFCLDILAGETGPGAFDLRQSGEGPRLAARLAEAENLAGLVVCLEDGAALTLEEEVNSAPALLGGVFLAAKSLLRSPARRFCFLLQRLPAPPQRAAGVLAQGVEGLLLAAAQEYSSVLCRSLTLDVDTDLAAAFSLALNSQNTFLALHFRGQAPYTARMAAATAPCPEKPYLKLNPGDVILLSGGARGITAHLAQALAPFQPRLVLVGRSPLTGLEEYRQFLKSSPPSEEAVRRRVMDKHPDLKGSHLDAQVARVRSGLEALRNLQELSRLGLEAEYYPADVADAAQAAAVVAQAVERFGRVDGIIHGAGLLRDSFLEFLSLEDFQQVVEVKLTGAWNLYEAAREHGLRFLVGLSSVAAVLGNPGQANYCAGNRAMTALFQAVAQDNPALVSKILALPPISGAGMADEAEIRELLKLKGLAEAYLEVGELAELFCHELFLTPKEQQWVMLARSLPPAKTVLLDLHDPPAADTGLAAAGLTFQPQDLPLIHSVSRLDYRTTELAATRTFTTAHDLWLEDHRPFKFLKYPLVSGIMAVETFLEAAHLLYPHLRVLGVSQVAYEDILACPPEVERETRIHCRRLEVKDGQVVCQVSLASRELSPSGRPLEQWVGNYQGQVILGGGIPALIDLPDFPVRPEELDTRPAGAAEVREWYENRTSMEGRYRVMEALDGTGPGLITGSTVYREIDDFAGLTGVRYRYSPYLLEAVMHLVNFYIVMRDEAETRKMIPAGLGQMRFTRRCQPGEKVYLQARLAQEDARGYTWNAQARDEIGLLLMQVTGLEMKWFGG